MDDDDFGAMLGGAPDLSDDDIELLGGPESQTDDGPGDLEFAGAGDKAFRRSLTLANVDSAKKGAPTEWFAKLLGISRTTVIRKIPDTVDPVAISKAGTRYYRPADVLPYLVKPRDIQRVIMAMNPRDLPERLRKEFWGARKLEQDVRLRAGDLWQTDDVHRVLGDLMKLVKDSVRLWTDTIDESHGLTTAQVETLDELSNKLLADFADAVAAYVKSGATRSQDAELDEDE